MQEGSILQFDTALLYAVMPMRSTSSSLSRTTPFFAPTTFYCFIRIFVLPTEHAKSLGKEYAPFLYREELSGSWWIVFSGTDNTTDLFLVLDKEASPSCQVEQCFLLPRPNRDQLHEYHVYIEWKNYCFECGKCSQKWMLMEKMQFTFQHFAERRRTVIIKDIMEHCNHLMCNIFAHGETYDIWRSQKWFNTTFFDSNS